MTSEDKMKSAKRGLEFLKLGAAMEPDIARGLKVYAYVNWVLGILFSAFWFCVATLLVKLCA